MEYTKEKYKHLILELYWTLNFLRKEGDTREFPFYMYDIECIEELNKIFERYKNKMEY